MSLDVSLRWTQENLPWTIPYSKEFNKASTQSMLPHLDMQHAMIHVLKSMGKLAARFDQMDHGTNLTSDGEDVPNIVADLVVCALRMANTSPWGRFDLADAVRERLEKRNNVKLEGPKYDIEDLVSDLKSRGLRFVDGDGDEQDTKHVEACVKQALETARRI